jgi:2-oxoglutarate dehydrogenase complex dehydrogenase (E1) component-like enzyme
MYGHRAASIDPLDLLQREVVHALDPKRYGLVYSFETYDVNDIMWTKRVGETPDDLEYWILHDIMNHLRSVYVGRLAYAVRVHALAFQDRSSLILAHAGSAYAATSGASSEEAYP